MTEQDDLLLINKLYWLEKEIFSYKDYVNNLDKKSFNRLIFDLLKLLDKEISRFNYNDEKDISYLFVLLNLLPELARDNDSKKKIIKELKMVHKTMKELLHSRPIDLSVVEKKRYNILKDLISKVEDTSLKFYISLPEDYDSSKEEYISYLIFKSKNLAFFNMALKKFPHIINYKSDNKSPLIDRVLDAYLESLDKYLDDINLGPIDDLIYYNKIFKAIITNPKLKADNRDEERWLNKIKEYLKTKNYDSNRLNEKLTYFVNNLFFLIKSKEDTTNEKNLNYEYEVHDEFKAANLSEAKRIYIINQDLNGISIPRKIYTFDGEGAFELDDGVSLTKEGGLFKLGIHIANPAFYIPNNSIVRTEARRRTRSLYVSNECIPMIPLLLSKDLISLNKNGYKDVISFYFDIDELSGKLVKYDIKNEIVKIYENKTYDDFDYSLNHSKNEEYSEFLSNLCRVSNIIKQEYNEMEDYQNLHNDNSHLISTSVISSLMVYANIKIAEYFDKRELPFIYRCHKIDDEAVREINELKERLKLDSDTTVVNYLEQLKNIYPKAYYTTINNGHMGLGVDYYSHSTSPLRRYADLANLEAIHKFVLCSYSKDDLLSYKDEFARISDDINSKRSTLDDYEVEYAKILQKKLKP